KTAAPLSNPAEIYCKFDAARQLLMSCATGYSCSKGSGVETLAPPRSLLPRLSAKSGGVPEVTRSRGLLLRSACALYRTVPEEKADALLKEVCVLSGRSTEDYRREASFLAAAYNMTKTEAVVALALHQSFDT